MFLLQFTLAIIEPNVQSTLLLTKAFRFSRKHLASYFYQNDLDITESFQYSGVPSVTLFLQDFLIFQVLRLSGLTRNIKQLCNVVSMEITSFFSACGSNKFHGQKNKLSRSMTRIIANFGRNFRSFCKNIKMKVFSESSL